MQYYGVNLQKYEVNNKKVWIYVHIRSRTHTYVYDMYIHIETGKKRGEGIETGRSRISVDTLKSPPISRNIRPLDLEFLPSNPPPLSLNVQSNLSNIQSILSIKTG